MNKTGLHIRLSTSIDAVAQRAANLGLPFFQTFAFYNTKQANADPTQEQIENFITLRKQFGPLFLHASYWINLGHTSPNITKLLDKELALSQKLGFNFFVVHPGSVGPLYTREQSIQTVAQQIDRALEKFPNITMLLENIAHKKRALGGNIQELAQIYELTKHKERVGFCIDTAHAYAFGYDLVNEQDAFLNLITRTLGLENIKLIHVTDTREELASAIDTHEIPGHGNIGRFALQRFIGHPTLKDIPVIIELPAVSEQQEELAIKEILNWQE